MKLLLCFLLLPFVAVVHAADPVIIDGGLSPSKKLAVAVYAIVNKEGAEDFENAVYLIDAQTHKKIGPLEEVDFNAGGYGHHLEDVDARWSPDGFWLGVNYRSGRKAHSYVLYEIAGRKAVPVTLVENKSLPKYKVYDYLTEFPNAGATLEWVSNTELVVTTIGNRPRQDAQESIFKKLGLDDFPDDFPGTLEKVYRLGKDGKWLLADIRTPNQQNKKSQGDETRYRVIDESTSPDGRYAIALGSAKKGFDWAEYTDTDLGGFSLDPDKDEKIVRNYVVDLKTKRILGETGGKFFGTLTQYNHHYSRVHWSADSRFFTQTIGWKWFNTCLVGYITQEGKLAGMADLTDAATDAAYAFLKKNKKTELLKHQEEFAVAVSVDRWEKSKTTAGAESDGIVMISFTAEVPKAMEENTSVTLHERLKVTKALKIEVLDVQFEKD